MRCRAVVIPNRDGLGLFGIVHEPAPGVRHPVPVILLQPGAKYRVAPHRLYVKLARHLARRGFVVLRFDFAGLGDSEGQVTETSLADFHGTVQLGRYVDDTCAVMDWMVREYGAARFILGGLCGGAITGLLAGERDERVDALVGWGLPVLLDSQNVDASRYLTSGELAQWGEGYRAKLLDPRSWRRLLSGRSNYRVILKVLTGPFRRRRAPAAAPDAQAPSDGNFNPRVPSAFRAMATKRRMLLVFGEADRLYSIYEERFVQPCGAQWRAHAGNVEVHVVPGANHIFSLPQWEQAMHQHLDAWLDRYYAATIDADTLSATSP